MAWDLVGLIKQELEFDGTNLHLFGRLNYIGRSLPDENIYQRHFDTLHKKFINFKRDDYAPLDLNIDDLFPQEVNLTKDESYILARFTRKTSFLHGLITEDVDSDILKIILNRICGKYLTPNIYETDGVGPKEIFADIFERNNLSVDFLCGVAGYDLFYDGFCDFANFLFNEHCCDLSLKNLESVLGSINKKIETSSYNNSVDFSDRIFEIQRNYLALYKEKLALLSSLD